MSREALLDAAFSILAREGDVRPDAVAAEARASKALVFHHFGSRAGLVDAMVERVLTQTREGLDALAREHPNPRVRLDALTRALLAEPPDPPREALHVARFWLEGDRARRRDALLEAFIERAIRDLRHAVDARHVAQLILSRWHGATILHATGAPIDHERELADTRRALEAMIGPM